MNNIKLLNSIPRPTQEDINKFNSTKIPLPKKEVDRYLIQSIIDRILGPDGDEYIKQLTKLNSSFKIREGKVGHELCLGIKDTNFKTTNFK